MSRYTFHSPRRMAGFNLIEVMIAVVLLSLGLLGMALLQTTALRTGQSSSERTVATMLAYQILDMVRTNRVQAASYNLIRAADFDAAGEGRTGICAAGADPPSPQWQADRDAWVCAARRALPDATGSVTVTGAVNAVAGPTPTPAASGRITVRLQWTDRVSGTDSIEVTTGL